MNHHSSGNGAKVGLLWRGDPTKLETPTPENNRLYPLFKALADLNVTAGPVPYSDELVDEIRVRLLSFDGVLVWVDPITEGRDRSKLDPMLKDLAEHGVWVSAHPDVIQKIGTKEVLFRTKHLGWGADTHLYANVQQFNEQFPARLKSSGPRVLKQRRGNGGIGTWKVELAPASSASAPDPAVQVEEARRGSSQQALRLSDFMERCIGYFADSGCLIDQSLQPRTAEGMIRCYLVHNRVAGFSTQMPKAQGNFAMAREKTMYEASAEQFAVLRTRMESEWVPAVQQLFNIDTNSLPAIWDADFLYGPKNAQGQDTYVLGEINVSAVLPFPESAVASIAGAVLTQVHARSRSARTSEPHA